MKDRNTLILCRRIMAIMLCAFISFAYMPFTGVVETRAYANGGEAQTVSEAEAQWNEAKRIKDVAQDSVNTAQGEFNTAESEYNAAVADRTAKENAKTSAQSQYEAAQTATQTALNEKNAAQTAKEEAQTTLSQATTTLNEKTQAVTTAQNELTQAQQMVNDKTAQWESEKTTAQTNLETAQSNFDKVGINFLNDKAGNSLKDTVWFDWLTTNMAGKSNPPITWDNVLGTEAFRKGFYSPYSYDNLMRSADLVAEGNQLRKSNTPSLSDLKISYKIMTVSIASNALSNHVVDHVLLNTEGYEGSQIYIDSGRIGWENISWGSPDPFMGWYYVEKIHYLADQYGTKQANVTESMVTQIVNEATQNGHDLMGYFSSYSYGRTMAAIVNNLNSKRTSNAYSTGHYESLINAYHKTTGLSTNSEGAIYYGICHVQNFSQSEMSDAVTPATFKSQLENYASTATTALNNAKAEVERLKTKPDYLQQAETNLSEKQTALDTANQEKTAAETAKSNAESALSAAETALSEKTTIYNNAVSNEREKQTAYNNAVTAYNAAVQTEANKKDAKDSAAGTLETKKNDLVEATEAEAAAKAVYDSFFKLENAIISAVSAQTFTGSAIEPSLVVKNKGETDTLVKGTDYDVEFSKNTNAGTASVKIKGTEGGSYTGEKTANFTIVAKEIEASMVTVTPLEADYSGNKQMPQVSVQYNGITLENGKDYTLTNNGGTNTGEYDVVVTGKENGNYSGTVSAKFKINTKDIAGADVEVSAIPEQLLTTEALRPEVTITYNGKSLATEDYDVAYRDNESEGTGRVTITGKGNFTGSREETFRILLKERAELNDLIKELEEELKSESDEEYLAAINAAIVEARALAEDKNAGREALSSMASKTRAARSAAKEALDERKAAAGKTAEEEEAARRAVEQLDWNGTLSGAVPAAKSVKAKAAKKSVKVSWKKATKKNLKKFDKVEIQVCTDRGFNRANTKRVEVKKSKKSATVKGLTKGMTYYVRVRDVKGSGTGKLVSKWSGVKKVKIKK